MEWGGSSCRRCCSCACTSQPNEPLMAAILLVAMVVVVDVVKRMPMTTMALLLLLRRMGTTSGRVCGQAVGGTAATGGCGGQASSSLMYFVRFQIDPQKMNSLRARCEASPVLGVGALCSLRNNCVIPNRNAILSRIVQVNMYSRVSRQHNYTRAHRSKKKKNNDHQCPRLDVWL
ncbi:hypothetical protein DFJ73DRAFT_858384, partial [Zopfochytrium polystomum]